MSKTTFRGGIDVLYGKDLSKDKPIKNLLPQGDLIFPMSSHIGEVAKPTVKKGDQVLVGQIIGEAKEALSANIISSVSGTVKIVEQRLTVEGQKIESVVVENDHEYTTVEGYGKKEDYTKLSKKEIRKKIRDAGIVGLGGAGFPTDFKLTPSHDDHVNYFIVNGAECEPFITSDYRIMVEDAKKIIAGIKIVLRLFEKSVAVIAIAKNQPEAISKFKELTSNEDRIKIKVLPSKYPSGVEDQLIYMTTGKKIHSGMLPVDVGCIVNNVETVLAIYNAVALGIPLIERVVTVSGEGIKSPGNLRVRMGTSYKELIEEAGGFTLEVDKLISGGPMMGLALYSVDVPVTRISSALIAFGKEASQDSSACIRCGKCHMVCPNNLMPAKLSALSNRGNKEGFIKFHGMECTNCGSCSYICPAKIKLVQSIKRMRNDVKKEKIEA